MTVNSDSHRRERRQGPVPLRGKRTHRTPTDPRRRPGHQGGRQQGRGRGGGRVRRPGHRAAARERAEQVRRQRPGVPLLLRAQDRVHEVLAGLRGAARRVRDHGRAVRGADPGPDGEDHPVPHRARGPFLLVGAAGRAEGHDVPLGQGGGARPGPAARGRRPGRGRPDHHRSAQSSGFGPRTGRLTARSIATRPAGHGTINTVPVLMLVVAVVILAGVVAVASGRGGEMAVPEPDYPPIDLGPVSAADVALLRPPSAAWGYNMRVTDEALEVIARAVTERDVQIAALQQQVSDLREQLGGTWPAEAGSSRADELEFPGGSPAGGPGQARGDLDDTVPPAHPEYPDYLEYPEYSVYREPVEHQSELDDPLTPAGPGPGAAAEPSVAEPSVAEPSVAESGVAEA